MRVTCLVFAAVVAVAATASARQQQMMPDSTARRLLRETLKAEKTLGSICPNTVLERRETFENDLLLLRDEPLRGPNLNNDVFIYEAFCRAGYSVKRRSDGTFEAIYTGLDHEGSAGFFAVNRLTRKIYHMWGGEEPIAAFNALMRDVKVFRDSDGGAYVLAEFFRKVVLGPHDSAVMECPVDVREAAEHNFHHAFGDAKWETEFEQWWAGLRFDEVSFDEAQRPENDQWLDIWIAYSGFRVAIPRSWTTGRPSVVENVLVIAKDGTVRLRTRTLYAGNKEQYSFE